MIEAGCNVCTLRKKSCFRPLSAREIKFVSKIRHGHESLAPGCFLVKAGAAAKNFYTLVEGWAALYRDTPHQPPHLIDIVLPGDLVAMPGALTGSHAHSVLALTPVRFCALDSSFFRKLVDSQSELSLAVMRYAAEEQSRRDLRSALAATASPVQRLAHLLLEIFVRCRAVDIAEGTMCPFPLRQSHLAELLGLSKVHLSRTLAALKGDGLVHLADNLLVIPDRNRLAEAARIAAPVCAKGRTII